MTSESRAASTLPAGRPPKTRALHALAALVALALPGSASALDGDLSGMRALARVYEGIPHRVTLRDPIAFVALDTGIQSVNVSDPNRPVVLHHLYLPSPAYDIALDGTRAYVANGESGLQIIDVTNPAQLRIIAQFPTSGTRGVAVAAGYAYLAEASAAGPAVYGIRGVDVRVPTAPVAAGFVALPNGALDIALDGTTAWVAVGSNPFGGSFGIRAFDISTPGSPSAVPGGSLATSLPVHELTLRAGVAYLATGLPSTGALVTANIASPGTPTRLASFALADAARGIALSGTLGYVAARSLGLLAFDLSNPASPRQLAGLPTGRETVAVAARGDVALLGERSSIAFASFTVVDTLVPAALRVLGSLSFAEATGADVDSGLAFLLRRDALHIYDGSNLGALAWIATWRPPTGDFSALDAEGNLVAIAEGRSVHLLDVSTPTGPFVRGSLVTAQGVAVRPVLAGSLLYVVTGLGLESFDVSIPAAPSALSVFATNGWSSGLAVAGSVGFLSAGDTLHVLDLSVPSAPTQLGSLRIVGEQLYGVAVDGNVAVVTGLNAWAYVIDVANVASPVLRGMLPGGTGFDVRLYQGRALVAAGEAGVRVIDVGTNPASPTLEAFFDTSGTAACLANSGPNLLVATLAAQHWVIGCDTCPAGCTEAWPTIGANSLKLAKRPLMHELFWTIASGSGSSNIHRTLDRTQIPTLHSRPTTFHVTVPGTNTTDSFDPSPSRVGYYQVYGRGLCSGESYP